MSEIWNTKYVFFLHYGNTNSCCWHLLMGLKQYVDWDRFTSCLTNSFFFFFSVSCSQLLCGLENRFSVWLFDQIRSALYKQTYVQRVVLTPAMKNYASMTHVSKFVICKWTAMFNMKGELFVLLYLSELISIFLSLRSSVLFVMDMYWNGSWL